VLCALGCPLPLKALGSCVPHTLNYAPLFRVETLPLKALGLACSKALPALAGTAQTLPSTAELRARWYAGSSPALAGETEEGVLVLDCVRHVWEEHQNFWSSLSICMTDIRTRNDVLTGLLSDSNHQRQQFWDTLGYACAGDPNSSPGGFSTGSSRAAPRCSSGTSSTRPTRRPWWWWCVLVSHACCPSAAPHAHFCAETALSGHA
jgi:hypothetical protein